MLTVILSSIVLSLFPLIFLEMIYFTAPLLKRNLYCVFFVTIMTQISCTCQSGSQERNCPTYSISFMTWWLTSWMQKRLKSYLRETDWKSHLLTKILLVCGRQKVYNLIYICFCFLLRDLNFQCGTSLLVIVVIIVFNRQLLHFCRNFLRLIMMF